MSDLIKREDAIKALAEILYEEPPYLNSVEKRMAFARKTFESIPSAENKGEWIPCSERLPEHSYTKRFWLTVKLDNDKDTVTTLIGTWGAWCGDNGNKSYDAFDCWKDVMINGGIYRLSQPIPKEQVLAWMPAPEPYIESRNK